MTILAVFCFVVFIITDLIYYIPRDDTTAEYLPWLRWKTGWIKTQEWIRNIVQTMNFHIKNKISSVCCKNGVSNIKKKACLPFLQNTDDLYMLLIDRLLGVIKIWMKFSLFNIWLEKKKLFSTLIQFCFC